MEKFTKYKITTTYLIEQKIRLIFNCLLNTKASMYEVLSNIKLVSLSLTTKSFIKTHQNFLRRKKKKCFRVSTIYDRFWPVAQDLAHIRYPINWILLSFEITSSAHIWSLLCPLPLASVPYEPLLQSCFHQLRAPHSLPWFYSASNSHELLPSCQWPCSQGLQVTKVSTPQAPAHLLLERCQIERGRCSQRWSSTAMSSLILFLSLCINL